MNQAHADCALYCLVCGYLWALHRPTSTPRAPAASLRACIYYNRPDAYEIANRRPCAAHARSVDEIDAAQYAALMRAEAPRVGSGSGPRLYSDSHPTTNSYGDRVSSATGRPI